MSLLRPLFPALMSFLLLILVACGGTDPASPEPAVTDPTAVSADAIDLPDAPTAVPTEPEVVPPEPEAIPPTEPVPTAEPATAVPPPTNPPADIAEASFNGVSFFYDQNLIANLTAAPVPAAAGTYGLPPDGPRLFFYDVPDYIKFDLQAAGDPATTWPAHLVIQPYINAEGNVYSGYEEWAFERDRLAAFAADMSQPITAVGNSNGIQSTPLSFSNGSGLRYLGILPPGPGLPTVTNDELYYLFNGFTADNRYFVYLQFPVSHPDLPSLDSIDFEALDAQYQAGIDPETIFAEELARLSEADPSSFTPPLDQLDGMISTLFVPAEASTISSIPRVDLTTCTPDVSFVEDITIPDGSPIEPNTIFTKTWRIINDGTCPITAAFEYFPVGENAIRPHNYNTRVPLTQPGETMDISVPLVAPPLAGYYRSEWQFSPPFDLANSQPQEPFGPRFYTEITVNRNAAVVPPTFGDWNLFSYQFGPVAAITEEEAQARYGTAVVFAPDSITFGDQTCTGISYEGEFLTAGDYFDTFYQFSSDTIYLQPTTPIAVIRTTCDIPGFGEFILHDEGFEEVFLYQDGVFFFLYPRQ